MRVYTLYHRPHRGATLAACHVGIHTHPHGTVVVLTEPGDNPGISVTNAVEQIAAQVAMMDELDPAATVWIEHYPNRHPPGLEDDSTFDETYDLVSFSWEMDGTGRLVPSRPVWKRLDAETAYRLMIGEVWIDPANAEATVLCPRCAVCGASISPDEVRTPCAGGCGAVLCFYCAISGPRCLGCAAELDRQPDEELPDAWLEAAYEDRHGYPDDERDSPFEEQYENSYVDDYPPGLDDACDIDDW
ncbi:MAG: hypothetical protein JXD18_14975 [Anaerolineae bacterium]|nr:hypothetical protein [Anaerolineae bacterium]